MGNSGSREQKVVFFKQVFLGDSYVSSNQRVTFLNLMGTFSHLQLKVSKAPGPIACASTKRTVYQECRQCVGALILSMTHVG